MFLFRNLTVKKKPAFIVLDQEHDEMPSTTDMNQFFVRIQGEQRGPYSRPQLETMWNGTIPSPKTLPLHGYKTLMKGKINS